MLGWVVRIFMILAGLITSFFVANDALNFSIIQTIITVLLFTSVVAILAFWMTLKNWFMRIVNKWKKFENK